MSSQPQTYIVHVITTTNLDCCLSLSNERKT